MRILHTADWHAGKRLGRYDRQADTAAVLDEIVQVANSESVELVLVAGDLFDQPRPPVEALRLVLATLVRLSAGGTRPVVAIAGNHDSPELLDLLADYLRPSQVHLVGSIRPPGEGGVLELQVGSERALIACLPFLREGRAVPFLEGIERWYGAYAETIASLCATYGAHLEAHGEGAVKLLAGHFLAAGVHLGGGGASRGERALHLGEAYAADGHTLPPAAQYAALGHIHAPQPIPGAPMPAEYCGSPLELDFGEAGEEKRVVLVDAVPGQPVTLRSHPLHAGRRLLRPRGRWDELVVRPELRHAYLDLTVLTDGPDPGLADRARQEFPFLVKVRAEYPRITPEPVSRGHQPLDALYLDYYRQAHGTEPTPELLAAFRDVLEEVLHAAP